MQEEGFHWEATVHYVNVGDGSQVFDKLSISIDTGETAFQKLSSFLGIHLINNLLHRRVIQSDMCAEIHHKESNVRDCLDEILLSLLLREFWLELS